MDNITHSLVGAFIADVEFRRAHSKKSSPGFRAALWLTSIIANNFPDSDALWSGVMGPRSLSYPLFHRGHTHTFITAILQGGILFAFLALFFRWRGKEFKKEEWRKIFILCALGPVVHIGCDYLNSYGVHPFWPFDNRWYYRDTLFIVEPWLWLSILPFMWKSFSSRAFKIGIAFLVVAAFALEWLTPFVPTPMAAVVSAWALVFFYLTYRVPVEKWRGKECLPALLLVFFFLGNSLKVKNAVLGHYSSQANSREVLDVVQSPLPSSPWCWRAMVISVDKEGRDYSLERWVVAALPGFLPVTSCVKVMNLPASELTIKMNGLDARALNAVTLSLPKFQEIIAENCEAEAFMRFARAPYWVENEGTTKLSDLRFDQMRRPGFGTHWIKDEKKVCDWHIPPWESPRKDLLTYKLSAKP
jgi:inner membrane protein